MKLIFPNCSNRIYLLYLYRLSPWSGWTFFLPRRNNINIAVYIAHWRRYFGIWLREESQVLPGKTPCLPWIFHRRIDRATRGNKLPEQTPPGFSPEPLWPGCDPNTAGCQTNPPWVAVTGTEVPDCIALPRPATLRSGWTLDGNSISTNF